MKSLQTAHIDEIVRVSEGARADRDPLILESWRRCLSEHKMDPAVLHKPSILPSEQLRSHREAMEQFIRTARFGLESLYSRVAGLGYVLLLTDSNGITIDFIGDPASDDKLKRAGLYLGADWNEARAGTCSVGTCLATGQPLTVHQTDHFDATHISLTCTATPVFNCRGELAAVLDISALTSPQEKASQLLALEFVKAYVNRIENASLMNTYRREWIIKLSRSPEFADVDPDYIIALDGGGRIIGFNHKAQEFLAGELDTYWRNTSMLLGQRFSDVFQCELDQLGEFVQSRPTEQRVLRLQRSEQALFVHATTPALILPSRVPDLSERSIPLPLTAVAGGDTTLKVLLQRAAKLINTRMSLLIQGETGTGKEYLAKSLHAASVRADKPFVAINCAALPESLIESELFGYEGGSFTGASAKGKRGLIVEADGGTLFLDEIGDMPLSAQTRLLRVLAEREVTPVGRTKPVAVDVRVIAATHRDLVELVKGGRFRDDLYFRLNGAVLTLPPLRLREDLDWLVDKLLRERSRRDQRNHRLSPAARIALHEHTWPGNIRELVNCLDYACAVSSENCIEVPDLPERMQQGEEAIPPEPVVELGDDAIAMLKAALQRRHWNISAVARELSMHRSTLYRQMHRYGVLPPPR